MTAHDDASLDVLALVETAVRGDGDGLNAMLTGALDSPHLACIVSTLTSLLCDELVTHHGSVATLAMLAARRGHVLRIETPDCDGETCDHPPLDGPEDDDETAPATLGDIAELLDEQRTELAALVRAVDRIGDILDRRLQ